MKRNLQRDFLRLQRFNLHFPNLHLLLFLISHLFGTVFTCIVYGTEQLEDSLCKSKACPFYAKCKLDEHSFVAKCVCPDECSGFGELSNIKNAAVSAAASQLLMIAGSAAGSTNAGSDYEVSTFGRAGFNATKKREDIINSLFGKTVCGSDGIDYESFCDLKKESCRTSREIKIFYFGKCSNFFFLQFNYKLMI